MPSCAFLTLANPEGYTIDDHLAAEELVRAGWLMETIPWSDEDQDWARFDAVVVRSTWDYYKKVGAFFETLERIEASGTRLLNDLDLMRWNADKRYIGELAERGVSVVPTIYGRRFERGDTVHFASLLESEKLVIKPVEGANADGAFRLDASSENPEALERFASEHFMVQPFVSSITTFGEVSLFYFGSLFSHAILKTPDEGDFRVQEEHGGRIVPWQAEDSALEAGDRVLEALDGECLYARVDLVRSNDDSDWWLMELEIIEPSMYFRMDNGAPARFREALEELLASG